MQPTVDDVQQTPKQRNPLACDLPQIDHAPHRTPVSRGALKSRHSGDIRSRVTSAHQSHWKGRIVSDAAPTTSLNAVRSTIGDTMRISGTRHGLPGNF
jgi:hypothetical protein